MFDERFADRLNGISGSAIRSIFSLLAEPDMISFAGGNPSPKAFPKTELSAIASAVIQEYGDTVLQYGGTKGTGYLTDSVVTLLQKQGLNASADEIIIISGASQGIELMSKAFIDPGDAVLVESPTFLGALQTFETYQAKLAPVMMDMNGMVIDDLESKIKKYRPKFVYTIPTFQNPTGRTLPEDRREAMVAVCKRYGVLILEDDPYSDLRYSGEMQKPIKAFDKNNIVVKLYSFSKIISPGLRVGAAMADKAVIAKFNVLKQGMDIHTSNLSQAVVDRYVRNGQLKPHITEVNRIYRKQMQKMLAMIQTRFSKHIRYTVPEGGLFIWIELPEPADATDIFKKAVKRKVAFVPGTHFFAEGGNKNTLRLNFSMVDEAAIEKGMKVLAEVLEEYV